MTSKITLKFSSQKWFPKYLIVDITLRNHEKVNYMRQHAPNAEMLFIEKIDMLTDYNILKRIPKFQKMSEAELIKTARQSLLLISQKDLFQSMSTGGTHERCCYNFLKIIPYRGVCQASCGYCWFQDKILIPRVNVTFIEDFFSLLRSNPKRFKNTVFTMTHYKTDCICIEHITGMIQDLYRRSHELEGSYIQILTKFADFDFLYNSHPKKEFIICFSMNTETINCLLEPKTSSIESRISAAKKLKNLGYTVLFRIDPMLSYPDSEKEYAKLASNILTAVSPDHITLGTPRFQSMEEVQSCLVNLNPQQYNFFAYTANQIFQSKLGTPVPEVNHSETAYFKNMQFSLSTEARKKLYQVFIHVAKDFHFFNIGLCEEPLSMWNSLGLKRSGNRAKDCACNYTPYCEKNNE